MCHPIRIPDRRLFEARRSSYCVIVEDEAHVSNSPPVVADNILVSLRPLVLRVACKHALNANTNTLCTLDRAPALARQEVQAYNTVGVDVRVHRDRSIR